MRPKSFGTFEKRAPGRNGIPTPAEFASLFLAIARKRVATSCYAHFKYFKWFWLFHNLSADPALLGQSIMTCFPSVATCKVRKVPTFHELISNSWPVSSGWGWFDVLLENKPSCLTRFSEKARQCGSPHSKCKGLRLLGVTCCEKSEGNHGSFCWCDRLSW